jgi:hypothetical protein
MTEKDYEMAGLLSHAKRLLEEREDRRSTVDHGIGSRRGGYDALANLEGLYEKTARRDDPQFESERFWAAAEYPPRVYPSYDGEGYPYLREVHQEALDRMVHNARFLDDD